ncbi:hypothetical protein [Endozoicomonas sp. 2B-B]
MMDKNTLSRDKKRQKFYLFTCLIIDKTDLLLDKKDSYQVKFFGILKIQKRPRLLFFKSRRGRHKIEPGKLRQKKWLSAHADSHFFEPI